MKPSDKVVTRTKLIFKKFVIEKGLEGEVKDTSIESNDVLVKFPSLEKLCWIPTMYVRKVKRSEKCLSSFK